MEPIRPQSNPDEYLGRNWRKWAEYREQHGDEAVRYRRLYEEVSRQIQNLYAYAEERGFELPSPDSSIHKHPASEETA